MFNVFAHQNSSFGKNKSFYVLFSVGPFIWLGIPPNFNLGEGGWGDSGG